MLTGKPCSGKTDLTLLIKRIFSEYIQDSNTACTNDKVDNINKEEQDVKNPEPISLSEN